MEGPEENPMQQNDIAIARPAASLLVLREGEPGLQVLMGMRGAAHKFMPNRLVFPGGAVDPEDHSATPATPLPDHVMRRLQRSASAPEAAALGIAAARELTEETGLSLGARPALDGLDFLCRAVTPEASPMRFDARFFVVDAARVHGSLEGSGELDDLRWYGVDAALALDLALATSGVLRQLQHWLTLSASQRIARADVPVLVNRVWTLE
jgi:8-oxo-dGTP pyrophosphatase MutT (NUDIX family)